MDWKKSGGVGVVAAVLIVVAIVVIVWYVSSSARTSGVPTATFICESSGKTFDVKLDATNMENEEYVTAETGTAVTCKLDGKKDAYLAVKDASGKWVKAVPDPGN